MANINTEKLNEKSHKKGLSSENADSIDKLDREDLIKLIKTMLGGGVVVGFNGKRTASEISKRVRPRVTRLIKDLNVGTPEAQAQNLLIEGENLQAMVTLYKYRGQVDLIVTDPPYNTGQYFRYNDRWDEDPNDPELGNLVRLEDDSRHTKWMKAMMPRLQMMKAMLKPQGVIAICIDENELFHLGMMLDEIFGEDNRIAIINWQKAYAAKNDSKHVSTATEYVLVYARDKQLAKTDLMPRSSDLDAKYTNPDNDPLGPWSDGHAYRREARAHDRYGIQSPFTGAIHYPGAASWRFPKKKMKDMLEMWGAKYAETNIGDGRAPALVIAGAAFPKPEKKQNLDHSAVVELDVKFHNKKNILAKKAAENVRDHKVWPMLFFLSNGFGRPRRKLHLMNVQKGIVPLTYWADEEYDTLMEIGSQSWDHEQSGHSQTGINELNDIGWERPSI